MGAGFRANGGWTFDSLVRAVRRANGGPYRLLAVRERLGVLLLLSGLPKRVAQNVALHHQLTHLPSRDCVLCHAECVCIAILDWRARKHRKVIKDVNE
jgi:hypothetical protein